jgi:hypothetical protein
MKKARKITVESGVPEIIASKLGVAVGDVVGALEGNLAAPRAKDARGLALVCYGGVLQATAPHEHKIERR